MKSKNDIRVCLKKCGSYGQNEVDASVKMLLAYIGGIGRFIKRGQKVLIKPNLVKAAKPQECATTHPAVVESVIKILKEIGCEVFVGDMPFADSTMNAMKVCGIYDVCKKHGAKIAAFDKKMIYVNNEGLVVKKFQLTSCFNDADSVINLPKLKTHSQLYFTGAVKNLYSIMPGPRRGFYHLKYSNMEYFANMLLDLYSLLRNKVVLSIMDGVYGMEGNGPINGNPKFAGVLGASGDALALDFVMCGLIGLNPDNLPTLHYAKKRKDYNFNKSLIKIIGEKTENISIGAFTEAEPHTLSMMPKFVNNFKDYITRHKIELPY